MTVPERRWFRFSLGTLFGVVSVAGLVAGYVAAYPRESVILLAVSIVVLPISWALEATVYVFDRALGYVIDRTIGR